MTDNYDYINGRKKKPLNLDKVVTFRISSTQLEKFKHYAPKYQTKIKELIADYISRCENIETRENKARNSYMA